MIEGGMDGVTWLFGDAKVPAREFESEKVYSNVCC